MFFGTLSLAVVCHPARSRRSMRAPGDMAAGRVDLVALQKSHPAASCILMICAACKSFVFISKPKSSKSPNAQTVSTFRGTASCAFLGEAVYQF